MCKRALTLGLPSGLPTWSALKGTAAFGRFGKWLAARAVHDARALASTALLVATTSHAGLISGFEQGLSGWDYIGDVSVQTSDIGTSPTQAQHMAFLTTMCDANSPPSLGASTFRCEITTNEHPYSGISSPPAAIARQFLGLPFLGWDFLQLMPDADNANSRVYGEGGAMKISFFAPQAGVVSFDWNKIGWDADLAYVSVWSDDPSAAYRVTDWINPWPLSMGPSDVQLCSRYYTDPAEIPLRCSTSVPSLNTESGWHTKSLVVPEAGWYWICGRIWQIFLGSVGFDFSLGNNRCQSPASRTVALVGLGLAGLAVTRRRKQ